MYIEKFIEFAFVAVVNLHTTAGLTILQYIKNNIL